MKMVSELYNSEAGKDIYVVGTGASLRVFPRSFFDGKVVIALNQAWKMVSANYAITIHPDLNIPEFLPGEVSRPEIKWVTGNKKTQGLLKGEQLEYALKNFYFFNYHGKPNTQPVYEPSDSGRVVEWLERPTEDYLYVWSSIAQAGANLAANLGAKNVIMVGCDNSALGNNHHSHQQHTRWKGVDAEYRYRQYYEGISEVRFHLRKRKINLVNMNPFLKLDDPEFDFNRLCDELNQEKYISEKDISPVSQCKSQSKSFFWPWR